MTLTYQIKVADAAPAMTYTRVCDVEGITETLATMRRLHNETGRALTAHAYLGGTAKAAEPRATAKVSVEGELVLYA